MMRGGRGEVKKLINKFNLMDVVSHKKCLSVLRRIRVKSTHILHKLKNARYETLGDLFFFFIGSLSVVFYCKLIIMGWEDPTTRNKMRKSM